MSIKGFSQEAPDLKAIWENIMQGVSNGTVNTSNWDLDGLGGIKIGNIDLSFLPSGKGNLQNLADMPGLDLLSGIFGGFGMEEIHNDGSLNHNVTWAILFTMREMRPQIYNRQRTIMSQQDSINMRIKQLYELELLTVNYLSRKQSDAVDIERQSDLIKVGNDISFLYSNCIKLCDDGGFSKSKVALQLKFYTHLATISKKVNDFAKKDGQKNMMNNQDRNEIIAYMYGSMKDMRGTLALALRELDVASKWKMYDYDILTSK